MRDRRMPFAYARIRPIVLLDRLGKTRGAIRIVRHLPHLRILL